MTNETNENQGNEASPPPSRSSLDTGFGADP